VSELVEAPKVKAGSLFLTVSPSPSFFSEPEAPNVNFGTASLVASVFLLELVSPKVKPPAGAGAGAGEDEVSFDEPN
jgi:hypothetical protein